MRKAHVTPLLFPTYLTTIRGSLGTRMFQHLFATVDGAVKDIARNGTLSCALFVSSLLHRFQLLAEPHATVSGTLKDLRRSGWRRIRTPRPGCVIHWSGITYADGSVHEHLGFYLGNQQAVSNSSVQRVPVRHHWTYGNRKGKPARPVRALYWHPRLQHSQR